MAKLPQRIVMALLASVAVIGTAVLWKAGELRPLAPHFDGSCRAWPTEASLADIRIDGEHGLAYVSYLDRQILPSGKHPRGTVMLLDLNAHEPHLRAALAFDPPSFRPRGLSLYSPPEGPRRLFVVSGTPGEDYSVEIFQQSSTGAFAHLETLRDPLLTRANAIVAVGARQFYLTVDGGMTRPWQHFAEMFLGSGLSSVLYYDGMRLRVAADHLQAAAGLAMSLDGTRLYVSEMGGKSLQVMQRAAASGDLHPAERVELDSMPQNLNIDAEGNLWIAAHPRGLTLVRHLRDPAQPAPTQIFEWTTAAHDPGRPVEIYLNRGEQISAGSVAAPYRGRLLIGSMADHKFLLCEPPSRLGR